MRALIIIAVALLAVAVANVDIHPTRTVVVTKYVKLHDTQVKLKVVKVHEPVVRPDGYMTRHQCDSLGRDAGFRDVVTLYGWPAGDDGNDSYAGKLYYPFSDDTHHDCVVDFWRNRVDHVTIERYWR